MSLCVNSCVIRGPSWNGLKATFGARQGFVAELHAFHAVLYFPAMADLIFEETWVKLLWRFAGFHALQLIRLIILRVESSFVFPESLTFSASAWASSVLHRIHWVVAYAPTASGIGVERNLLIRVELVREL